MHGPDVNEPASSEASNSNAPSRGTRPGTPFNSWLPSAPIVDRPVGDQALGR